MKYLFEKDKKRRHLYKKKEFLQLWLKTIFRSQILPEILKEKLTTKWFLSFRNCFFVKIKSRCNFSNRGLGIHTDLGVSRIKLRKYSSFGYFCGIQKASW
jgi:ribosomal protein S14